MLKNFVSLLLSVLFSTALSFGQAMPADNESVVIKNLEIQWMTALAKKDQKVLDQMLGRDFELSKIGGDQTTNISRQQWMINSLQMDWSNFHFTNMQIKIDSDVATVNTRLSFSLKPYPFQLSSGVLDVWRKGIDGNWKIEKRFLSEDNLSRWLKILLGIGIGMLLLLLIQWIKRLFAKNTEDDDEK